MLILRLLFLLSQCLGLGLLLRLCRSLLDLGLCWLGFLLGLIITSSNGLSINIEVVLILNFAIGNL